MDSIIVSFSQGTPLEVATQHGNAEIVEKLIDWNTGGYNSNISVDCLLEYLNPWIVQLSMTDIQYAQKVPEHLQSNSKSEKVLINQSILLDAEFCPDLLSCDGFERSNGQLNV